MEILNEYSVLSQLVDWVHENLTKSGLTSDHARFESQTVYEKDKRVYFAGAVVADFSDDDVSPKSIEEIKLCCMEHAKITIQAVTTIS